MSKESQEIDDAVRKALKGAPVVWTPQCPEPEALLEWIDRETVHPQAALLLDHVFSCAYCRGEFAALCAVRGRVPVAAATPRLADRIAAWVAELMEQNFTSPVRSVRLALQGMGPAVALRVADLGRGPAAPTALRPAWTAVRTSSPTVRWSVDRPAPEYVVTVKPKKNRKRDGLVWEGGVGAERHLTLPEQAGLEPGGVYLWQVTAREAGEEKSSAPVWFAVLGGAARRQLEALEPHTGDGTPERVALYEAYGLYDEALQQAEGLSAQHPEDAALAAIRARLQKQMAG
jgi:hypothetical protein